MDELVNRTVQSRVKDNVMHYWPTALINLSNITDLHYKPMMHVNTCTYAICVNTNPYASYGYGSMQFAQIKNVVSNHYYVLIIKCPY